MQSLIVQVFKKRVDMVVSGHGGDRLIVEPHDLSGFLQP